MNETDRNGTWSQAYGDASRSRIINVIISHRVATLNYWMAYDLVVGQPLYLIVKRHERTGHWQVVPWADSARLHPTIADLEFTWEGQQDLGVAVHVGYSGNDQSARDLAGGAAALGVTQSLIDRGVLQTIDVHLRLGTHV